MAKLRAKKGGDQLARLTRAVALHNAGNLAEAEALYRQVLAKEPGQADALHLLGVLNRGRGNFAAAIPLIRQALAANPGLFNAHRSLGNALSDAGEFETAASHYRQFLTADPNIPDVWISLGSALKYLPGRAAEAEAAYNHAIALQPSVKMHLLERGLGRLLAGEYTGGWADWENRWEQPELQAVRPKITQPYWQGEDLSGRTLLVFAEQGFGDTFHFVRYLPLLVRRGAKLVFVAQKGLQRVLAPMEQFALCSYDGGPLPPFDYQCSLLSLPHLFGTTLETVPAEVPYLTAEPDLSEHWKARVDAAARGALKVGVIWAGKASYKDDRRRSPGFTAVKPLFDLPGVHFFALQVGDGRTELASWNAPDNFTDLGTEIGDFADTAAIMTNLDLVISSCTSAAHLAGALGRPLWMLISAVPSWQWILGRNDTPWYPTARLIRQARALVWDDVIDRVRQDLAALVEARSAPPGRARELVRAVDLHNDGHLEEAEALYRQVLVADPTNADAIHLLGVIQRTRGDFAGAIAMITKALELNPSLNTAHRNLGNALSDCGRYEEAVAHYRRFLSVEPEVAGGWVSLGSALKFLNRPQETEEAYSRAVELEPTVESHRFERGLGRLLYGDYAGGWADWEFRWHQPQLKPLRPDLVQPEWRGEDLNGRTILVYVEQGFGDAFQFFRYVPLLAERGARVILAPHVELMRVLKPLACFGALYKSGTELPRFDLQCPLLSLPRHFDTTVDTIPANVPYLEPEPELMELWHRRLAGMGGEGLNVGLVWTGRATHGNDHNRSLPPEALAPILAIPGVNFFSLQNAPRPGHLDVLAGLGRVHDLSAYLDDFAQTAAALAGMDLLITVDTAVAHLAGALGRPIWVFLPVSVDWRWLLGRDTSPWYPDSRLFRRSPDEDWLAVSHRVASALSNFTPGPRPTYQPSVFAAKVPPPMNDGSERLQQALVRINANDIPGALQLAEALVAERPNDAQALYVLGEAKRRAGDLAGACALLLRAAALAPGDSNIAYRGAMICAEAGNRPEAARLFRAVTSIDPKSEDAWFNLGVILSGMGSNAEAAQAFASLVRLNRAHGTGWRNLGVLLYHLGRREDAEGAFRNAMLIDPTDLNALTNLAATQQTLERFAAAIVTTKRAVRLAPTRRDLVDSLITLLRQEDRSEEAAVVCRAVLSREPNSADMFNQLGLVLRDVGKAKEAIEAHTRSLALDPDNSDYLSNLGYALRRDDQPVPAEKYFRRAIERDGNNEQAHIGLASLLFDADRPEEAQAVLDDFDIRQGAPRPPKRSVVIAVLDYSPGSPYNIRTLLDDLKDFDGEVICVFNGETPFRDLHTHPRIDKFSFNKHNVGVSRGWNIGINQAEGETIYILNADLKVSPSVLYDMERHLQELPDALCVGVSGDWLDAETGKVAKTLAERSFDAPVQVDQVSGHIFALHARRLHDAGISFDPRLAPYLYEENDLAIKARQNGYKVYAVPVRDYRHVWGISRRDRRIYFFGRQVNRLRCMIANTLLLRRRARRPQP
ncbi:MAG: tetratricopeptide repeat protein [Alphaproteobacteria bacterium]